MESYGEYILYARGVQNVIQSVYGAIITKIKKKEKESLLIN